MTVRGARGAGGPLAAVTVLLPSRAGLVTNHLVAFGVLGRASALGAGKPQPGVSSQARTLRRVERAFEPVSAPKPAQRTDGALTSYRGSHRSLDPFTMPLTRYAMGLGA